MNKKIAMSVFLATLLYQFIDASAELFLPFYDRSGIIAALLFWLIPAGTAFIIGFRESAEQAMNSQRRKRVYISTVLGAGTGQFLSIVILLPTPALPDMTFVGSIILTGITVLYIIWAPVGGITLVRAANGEELISYRLSVIFAGMFLLLAVSDVYNATSYDVASVGNAFAGVWFLILTRTLKQNKESTNENVSSTA